MPEAPNVKAVKVYATIESVIEQPCSPAEVDEFVRNQKFRGNVTVNYSQGGLTNIVIREHIPLTMAELDSILKG